MSHSTDIARRLLAEPDFLPHLQDLLCRPQRELEAIADSMNVCWQRRAAGIVAKQIIANKPDANDTSRFAELLRELEEAKRRQSQP